MQKAGLVEVVLVKKSEDESIIFLIIYRPDVAQVSCDKSGQIQSLFRKSGQIPLLNLKKKKGNVH